MNVRHKHTETKGMFYVEEEGETLAAMTYTMPAVNKMIIDHTEVSDKLRGKNAGYQLVHAAVEYARKHQLTIIPLCPFAASVFKRKPAFSDVLS